MEEEHGITLNHYYSLLGGYEIELKGDLHRLVKIRNPRSKIEWKGKWSDYDPLWKTVPIEI